MCVCLPPVLLQHGADPNIRNTDGKSALDLADPSAKTVLTGTHTHTHSCIHTPIHTGSHRGSCKFSSELPVGNHNPPHARAHTHTLTAYTVFLPVIHTICSLWSPLSVCVCVFLPAGEYKKDELLEAARWVCVSVFLLRMRTKHRLVYHCVCFSLPVCGIPALNGVCVCPQEWEWRQVDGSADATQCELPRQWWTQGNTCPHTWVTI